MIGTHTKKICYEIDDALESIDKGECVYLDVEVTFRHGKSDLFSRALQAYLLGRYLQKNPDLIMTGYGADLIEGFSTDVKDIIRSKLYREVFPEIFIRVGRDKISEWQVRGSTGKVVCVSLGGQFMGKGAMFLTIDDFLKSKEAARSKRERDRSWNSFTDLMTRLAPVHGVFLIGTSWHVDDMRQRILKAEKEDKDFPKFRHIKFPAKVNDKSGKWTGKYLFEERMGKKWYNVQYAVNGRWSNALLDCEPMPDTGNLHDTRYIQIHDNLDEFPDVRYIRPWDLASSEEQRISSNPDFTVGGLGTITQDRFGFMHLWIKDCVWGKWEAPERDAIIRRTSRSDPMGIQYYVETFGAYKDAYTTLKKVLRGQRTVRKSNLSGDKVVKCAALEPIFEAGHVHLLKGDWNEEFKTQFTAFPEGDHDDFCDVAAMIYHEIMKEQSGIFVT